MNVDNKVFERTHANINDTQEIIYELFHSYGAPPKYIHETTWKKIQENGKDVTSSLVAEVFNLKIQDRLPSPPYGNFWIVIATTIYQFAGQQHAGMVMNMLCWEELSMTHEQNIRNILLDTLKRVGDTSLVERLDGLGQKLLRIDYNDRDFFKPEYAEMTGCFSNEYDQRKIDEVIEAIVMRAKY